MEPNRPTAWRPATPNVLTDPFGHTANPKYPQFQQHQAWYEGQHPEPQKNGNSDVRLKDCVSAIQFPPSDVQNTSNPQIPFAFPGTNNDEIPLLEELGIYPSDILQRLKSVILFRG